MTRRSSSRCNTCKRPVIWLSSPFAPDKWRSFEPASVNGRTYQGVDAYPTEGKRTYRFREFVEELLMRRQNYSRADAEDEAYDVPWHRLHHCPPGAGPAPITDSEGDEDQ